MWRTVGYLLTFYITLVAAQNCEVSKDGVLIQQWGSVILDSIEDSTAPGFLIETLTYENVNSVEVITDAEGEKVYIEITNSAVDKTVEIKLNNEFLAFEQDHTASVSLVQQLRFNCADGLDKTMTVVSVITYTNDKDPVFYNFNNLNNDGYVYVLPIPFPSGVSISSAYNEIWVVDIDIDHTNVIFEVDDPSGNFIVEMSETEVDENGKMKYFARLEAKQRIESTVPMDFKIKATDVGGGSGAPRTTEVAVHIDIDFENTEPLESSAFTSLLYICEIADASEPVGPLVPHTPIQLLNPPVEPVEVSVVAAPGDVPFYDGLFTVVYDAENNVITLSRSQELTAEMLENENLIIVVKALASTIFEAETLVHINLPAISAQGEFSSNFYTTEISDPTVSGELLTNEPLVVLSPPQGALDLILAPAIDGEPWVDDQFGATYDEASSTVSLQTLKPLEDPILSAETITISLTASQASSNFEAVTLIRVDIPSQDEETILEFSSTIYTAVVSDPETTAALPTNPSPILIRNVPSDDITVTLEAIPNELFVPEQFSVEYQAGGTVTLQFESPLKPEAQNIESVRMILKASHTDGSQGTTIVHVDLTGETGGMFAESFYSSKITDTQLPEGSELTMNPAAIKIVNPPTEQITLSLTQIPGEDFLDDQFVAEHAGDGNVLIKLKVDLKPEALWLESVRMLLTATTDAEYEATTVIHIDLPQTTSSFSSLLYTTVIENVGQEPGILVTNPEEIMIEEYPLGEIVVELLPFLNEPFVPGQFGAAYAGEGKVTLSLLEELTPEALQYEYLQVTLKATKDDVGFEASSVITINIPQIIPTETSTFDSLLYTSDITDAGMLPGFLTTNPEKIMILNPPADDVAVVLVKIPGENFVADQFKVEYTGEGEIKLSLAQTLSQETLQNEYMTMKLQATNLQFGTIETVITINIPNVPEPGSFNSVFHTTSITDGEMQPGVLQTDPKITLDNPPADFSLTLEKAPGVENSYEEFFTAERVGQTNEISFSLKTTLTSDVLGNEVVVLLLKASNSDGYMSETTVQVDLPPTVPLPPGDPGTFTSVIYVTQITDSQFTGDLTTEQPIQITEMPPNPVPTLTSIDGLNSYVEQFSVRIETDTLIVSLSEPLPPEAFEGSYLTMTIVVTSSDDPEYKGETVLHVKLPQVTCPTCPPCTTTTPIPPATITFEKDPYLAEQDAGYTGQVFDVNARYNGEEAIFEYSINSGGNSEIDDNLSIDRTNGMVTIVNSLVPGKYIFRVTAKHESGDESSVAAIINMLSTSPCAEGVCFENAVITVTVVEATDQVIIPGKAVDGCKFYINDVLPNEAIDWLVYTENEGELSITKASDIEADVFYNDPIAQINVILQTDCSGNPRLNLRNKTVYPRDEFQVDKTEMLVIITLKDMNDNKPQFINGNSLVVGYPNKNLAKYLLPGAIAQLKATDKDVDDTLEYYNSPINNMIIVEKDSGSVYPKSGLYTYEDTEISVVVYDKMNQGASLNLEVRHVSENQIAVLYVSNAFLENVDDVLAILNDQLDDTWAVLQTSVIADSTISLEIYDLLSRGYPIDFVNKRPPINIREGESSKIMIVLYALAEDDNRPLSYNDLKSELEELDTTGLDWTVSSIKTWNDAVGGGDPGTETDTSGLEAAVITLGVLTGVFAIALVVLVYVTVFRKRQQKKMMAKAGFKNRTSFSSGFPHLPRDSMAVHNGRKENGTAPEWHSSDGSEDNDQDERKKSMVTFSDETEVIPQEVARL